MIIVNYVVAVLLLVLGLYAVCTQKNLIKMLPVLFVTHSWNMAPAVLISARSLLQA